MAPKVIGVIPARLDSQRFYGKVLFNYRGKPLLQYLFAEISKSKAIDHLYIATDSNDVKRAAEGFGAEVIMTPRHMRSGTDRVAVVMNSVAGDVFVNVQGDTFGLKHSLLDKTAEQFVKDPTLEYGTLARKIESDIELKNPDAVKVVLKDNGDAGWFSRSPLPYLRHGQKGRWCRQFNYYYHVGVYFFRRAALKQFTMWPSSPNEKAESLEQLRILENGKNIRVFLTNMKTFSVDSPKDVPKLRKVIH